MQGSFFHFGTVFLPLTDKWQDYSLALDLKKRKLNQQNMNPLNTQIQMRKGLLEFCILHIIARGEVYSSELIEELTEAKLIVVEGTLYPLLQRLKNASLVSYRWVESESGPPRKYFAITADGKKYLEKLNETWEALVSSTQKITSKN